MGSQDVNSVCTLLLEILKEYRKLDDVVTMRINRTTAQFRDRDRAGASGKGNVQERACAYLWQELVGARANKPYHHEGRLHDDFFFFFSSFHAGQKKANWKRRAEIIDYCVKVVDEAQQDSESDQQHPGAAKTHSSLPMGVTDEAKVILMDPVPLPLHPVR